MFCADQFSSEQPPEARSSPHLARSLILPKRYWEVILEINRVVIMLMILIMTMVSMAIWEIIYMVRSLMISTTIMVMSLMIFESCNKVKL